MMSSTYMNGGKGSKRITIREGLDKIFDAVVGGSKKHTDKCIRCTNCGEKMKCIDSVTTSHSYIDFYECVQCKSTAEMEYDPLTLSLKSEFREYSHKSADEIEVKTTKSKPFSVDRMWEVYGTLCYPVLVKSSTNDDSGLLFVDINTNIEDDAIEGFICVDDNFNKVKISRTQHISLFFNPYLVNIPHGKTYNYLSFTASESKILKVVSDIRFNFISTKCDGYYVHELMIIKDFPTECYGIEINVEFETEGINKVPKYKSMIPRLKLSDIIKGKDNVTLGKGYKMVSYSITKNNCFETMDDEVSSIDRNHLYEEIRNFFNNFYESVDA